jgi:hypothetical protein
MTNVILPLVPLILKIDEYGLPKATGTDIQLLLYCSSDPRSPLYTLQRKFGAPTVTGLDHASAYMKLTLAKTFQTVTAIVRYAIAPVLYCKVHGPQGLVIDWRLSRSFRRPTESKAAVLLNKRLLSAADCVMSAPDVNLGYPIDDEDLPCPIACRPWVKADLSRSPK